jgi:hypothetical protein
VWWACANGACAGTAIAFADMGGAFGGCPPDGVADGHDRFHALNCFSDTSASGQSGYPCEAAPPAALNVDAGGPFGSCPPDGVCDGNDAFHALNSFEGSSACSCPSGGPGPAPALPPAEAVRAELSLEPDQARIRPGQLLRVDVRLVTPVDGLRGYQLHAAAHGGRSGSCKLVDMAVEDRPDEVFAGLGPWRAFNVGIAQMVAGLDGPGVRAPKRAYLATLIFQVSADAAGRFTIELLADAADPEQRTFLFPADPQTRIDVAAAPVEITIGAKRRERSSQAR